jgi:hypothetical protein
MLHRRGFVTHAVTDDGYSAMLQRGTGIEQGFDGYHAVDELPATQRNDSGTAELAMQVLSSTPNDRRIFLWVHFFGTHWPAEDHPGIRRYGSTPEDGYDHDVAYMDSQLIRLLDAIAARSQPTAIFITADHGENFNAATAHHGYTLDEPVIRIPLLAQVPGWKSRAVTQLASAVDLVPTILALVGSPIPPYLDGIDLGPTLDAPRERALLSDTWRYEMSDQLLGDFAAAYDGTRKFTLDAQSGAMFFAEQDDPNVIVGKLVSPATKDALSDIVSAYVEESGPIRLEE